MPIRTFVAAWPPPEMIDIAAPDGLRLVPPERRHVTLRFLGDVPGNEELAVVAERLSGAGLRRCDARVATVTATFGRSILVVHVEGLTALAAGVVSVTSGMGSQPPDDRPFAGHVTLARGRDLRRFRGLPVPGGAWDVSEVTVVTSRLGGRSGPAYEKVATIPLLHA